MTGDPPAPPARITRRAGPVALRGFRAPTLAALLDAVAALPGAPLPLFADLNPAPWRGHQAARELLAQLGRRAPRAAAPRPRPASAAGVPSYADTVAAGIDAEAAGRGAVSGALALAGSVAAALARRPPTAVVLLVPRSGEAIGEDNAAFLRFLARALAGGPHRVVLAGPGALPPEPEGCTVEWDAERSVPAARASASLLAFVPGIVDGETAERLAPEDAARAGLHPLPDGGWLVPPEMRPGATAAARLGHDRLAAAARELPALAAYAQLHGSSYHADPERMAAQAWRLFEEGAGEPAMRLAAHAVACARGTGFHDRFLAQAQGMRTALQRFAELAEAPEPAAASPPALRSFLHEARGWGLVMTGRAQEAAAALAEARAALPPGSGPREELYLLNISALGQLRTGDVEGALATEEEIARRLAALDPPDRRLEYVNGLNLARLHQRRGAPGCAEACYARAFATTDGGRSTGDQVYAAVTAARLHAAQGRREAAFAAWVRAALHWAGAAVPEALAPRAARAIAGSADAGPEEVSRTLADELARAASARGVATGEAAGAVPVFLAASEATPAERRHARVAAGDGGWGVLLAEARLPAPYEGPEHRRLRALLWCVVRSALPSAPPAAGTVLVPDRWGRDVPGTLAELAETAAAFGVRRLVFAGREIPFPPGAARAFEAACTVAPGPLVECVDEARGRTRVTFRRYRLPRTLAPRAAAAMRAVAERPSAEAAAERAGLPIDRTIRLLRAMERARLVTFIPPENPDAMERLVPGRV